MYLCSLLHPRFVGIKFDHIDDVDVTENKYHYLFNYLFIAHTHTMVQNIHKSIAYGKKEKGKRRKK